LTKRTVDNVKPGNKDVWLWDAELPGFGLRVKPSGNKSYLIQYRNVHGATRRFTIGKHGVMTPDEARREARVLLADVERGSDPSANRKAIRGAPDVSSLIARYLDEHVCVHNKPSTARDAERICRKVIAPALGHKKVADVQRADVAHLHQRLSSTPRQANVVLAVLSKMFNLAELWGLRSEGSNPCRHLRRYPERRRERYLSDEELARVGRVMSEMQAAGEISQVVADAIRLLALTGCRLGEILNLQWEDVNLDKGLIKLRDAKTGSRQHVIGTHAIELISALPRIAGSPWLFCGTRVSDRLRNERLEKAWQASRVFARVEDVRLHDLRHTVGTFAGQAGANAFLIRDKLGHKTIAMTGRYVNRDDNPLRVLSNTIETRIAAAMGRKDPA
jgi:integrase